MTDMYRFATPPAINDLFERFQFHQNGNDISLQLEIAYTHVCETSNELLGTIYLAMKQPHERQSNNVPDHTGDNDFDQNVRTPTGDIITAYARDIGQVAAWCWGWLSKSTTNSPNDDRETVNLRIIAAAARSYGRSLKLLVDLLHSLRGFMAALMTEMATFRSDEITETARTTIHSSLAIKGEEIIEACVGILLTQMDQIMRMHSIEDKISTEDQTEWSERLESKKSSRIEPID